MLMHATEYQFDTAAAAGMQESAPMQGRVEVLVRCGATGATGVRLSLPAFHCIQKKSLTMQQ